MDRGIASHSNLAMLAVAAVAVVVASLLPAIPSASAATTPSLGGWTTVKNAATSQYVEDLASFAVDEHNKKEGTHLKFVWVVSAKSQVVAGTSWSITLQAVAARSLGRRHSVAPLTTYVAEVYEKPLPPEEQPVSNEQPFVDQPVSTDFYELVSFTKIK